MQLRYTKSDGTPVEFELSEQPITIGRSADADIVLLDERVSRIHCGMRLWDGDFYIKDLKSRNGTWVNNKKIDVAKLKAGDLIRVGSTAMTFEQIPSVGTETALQEIEGKMDLGKGYTTILREIVEEPLKRAEAVDDASENAPAADAPAPGRSPGGLPVRKPLQIKIKRRA